MRSEHIEYGNLSITEALLFMESLDSRFKLDNGQDVLENLYDVHHKITEHRRYDLDEGKSGHLHVWKRNGAYEIHHTIGEDDHCENGVSGKMVHTKDVNSKFVGTMLHVAKHLVDSGKTVCIAGVHTPENKMFNHYNRMANILAKKHGYVVSEPKPYNLDSENSKDVKMIRIHKYVAESGIPGLLRMGATLYRNESNNYGLDFTPTLYPNIVDLSDDSYHCG
jgi:hypothetical protein